MRSSTVTLASANVDELFNALTEIQPQQLPIGRNQLDWRKWHLDRPDFGGVYCLWWDNRSLDLQSNIDTSSLAFAGPGGEQFAVEISPLFCVNDSGFIALYVGKAASDIAKRIGQHLMLGTERVVAPRDTELPSNRMRTSNQLRDRLDRLFVNTDDTRPLLEHHVRLTYLQFNGNQNLATRFYLEDYAIGCLRPAFNLDSER